MNGIHAREGRRVLKGSTGSPAKPTRSASTEKADPLLTAQRHGVAGRKVRPAPPAVRGRLATTSLDSSQPCPFDRIQPEAQSQFLAALPEALF